MLKLRERERDKIKKNIIIPLLSVNLIFLSDFSFDHRANKAEASGYLTKNHEAVANIL